MARRDPKNGATAAPERRSWCLVGLLALIGIEGLILGYSYPFFSLALEQRHLSTAMIGLNASLAGAGILAFAPFLPRLIERIGLNALVALLFAISMLSFAALLGSDHPGSWFGARFILGACLGGLWIASEIRLDGEAAGEHSRADLFAAMAVVHAGGQFLGTLLLGGVGTGGAWPLVMAILPLAVATIMALSIRPRRSRTGYSHAPAAHGFNAAITLVGSLVAGTALAGAARTAIYALLPLYGLSHGFGEAGAIWLVAVFILGEAVLIAGIGRVAALHGWETIFRLGIIGVVLTCGLLWLAGGWSMLLIPALFLAGGLLAGIPVLGLFHIDALFEDRKRSLVFGGLAFAYATGAALGPGIIGYLMDIAGAEALPVSIALGFLTLSAFVFLVPADAQPEERRSAPPPVPSLNYIDEAHFEEESFGKGRKTARATESASLPPAPPMNEPKPYYPPTDNYRVPSPPPLHNGGKGEETELEKTFRLRAMAMAERAAGRQKSPGSIATTAVRQERSSNPFRPPGRNRGA